MKYLSFLILSVLLFPAEPQLELNSFHDLSAVSIDEKNIPMADYKGKMILVVNVASKCGYTPQYEGLQKLFEMYEKELVVLGFPSNNFLWQEPGKDKEIKLFCKKNFGVSFPLFSKISVKGRKQHPIYQWLSDSTLNGWNDKSPSWNFNKYLINEEGKLLEHFGAEIEPTDTLITRYFTKGKDSGVKN